jgi:RNA polymerase sigma factor (sigma-70 family)
MNEDFGINRRAGLKLGVHYRNHANRPSSMCAAHSVSQLIANLKEGKAEAANRLWERYAIRLVEIAKKRLGNAPKRLADEEDVAASVFHSVCRGAAAGRFQDIKNRDELWWLLLAITKQKVVDHLRREMAQKRIGRRSEANSGPEPKFDGKKFTLDDLVSDEPTPDFAVMLQEQHERLLSLLRDDSLRRIAVSRIEGFTVAEIANDHQMSTRSVERKLKLIREAWSKEL